MFRLFLIINTLNYKVTKSLSETNLHQLCAISVSLLLCPYAEATAQAQRLKNIFHRREQEGTELTQSKILCDFVVFFIKDSLFSVLPPHGWRHVPRWP